MPIPAVIGAVGALAATGLTSAANNYASAEQRNWLAYMQDRTNRYNSPEHQRLLMRQGGANPALAMQNGMFASPTSQQPSNYERPQFDFSPVAESINSGVSLMAQRRNLDSQSRLTDENTIAQQQRNKFGLVSAYLDVCDKIADLEKKGADTSFLKKQADYMQKQIDAFDKRNNSEVNKIDKEAAVAEEQANLFRLQASTQEIINEYLPQEKRRALQVSDATIRQLLSAAKANDADAAYKAAAKLLTEAEAKGVKLDNHQKDVCMDAIVDDYFNKADESYWSSLNARQEAGKSSGGAGPVRFEQRHAADEANDVYHQRVRHDKNGRKYIYDSRSNKRIYIK